MALSYSQGLGTTPLLGETIGANFDRAVREHPDRDALVVRHQDVRFTYARARRGRRPRRPRARRPRARARATASASGRRTAPSGCSSSSRPRKLGVILVNINPAYRTTELAYALHQSGCRALVSAPSFKTSDYAAMIEEVRGDLPALEHVLLHRRGAASTDAPDDDRVARARPRSSRSTSSTRAAPRACPRARRSATRNILNNGFFVGECCDYTEADRVCIPVPFYHCFGMVMGNLGAVTHGACMVVPAPSFEPAATLAAVGRGALHEPLRRADDVHRRARPPGLRRVRPVARCGPGSWPARRAPRRSCARSSTACTWRR